jgi:hypothetical protein
VSRSGYRLIHATYTTYKNGDATDVGTPTGQPEKGGGQQGKQLRTNAANDESKSQSRRLAGKIGSYD